MIKADMREGWPLKVAAIASALALSLGACAAEKPQDTSKDAIAQMGRVISQDQVYPDIWWVQLCTKHPLDLGQVNANILVVPMSKDSKIVDYTRKLIRATTWGTAATPMSWEDALLKPSEADGTIFFGFSGGLGTKPDASADKTGELQSCTQQVTASEAMASELVPGTFVAVAKLPADKKPQVLATITGRG